MAFLKKTASKLAKLASKLNKNKADVAKVAEKPNELSQPIKDEQQDGAQQTPRTKGALKVLKSPLKAMKRHRPQEILVSSITTLDSMQLKLRVGVP